MTAIYALSLVGSAVCAVSIAEMALIVLSVKVEVLRALRAEIGFGVYFHAVVGVEVASRVLLLGLEDVSRFVALLAGKCTEFLVVVLFLAVGLLLDTFLLLRDPLAFIFAHITAVGVLAT